MFRRSVESPKTLLQEKTGAHKNLIENNCVLLSGLVSYVWIGSTITLDTENIEF